MTAQVQHKIAYDYIYGADGEVVDVVYYDWNPWKQKWIPRTSKQSRQLNFQYENRDSKK